MIQVIAATYEGGVFKPHQRPDLSENERVRLIVEPTNGDTEESLRQNAWASLEGLWQKSTLDSHGDRLSRDQLHERS